MRGTTADKPKGKLDKHYGTPAPSNTTVKRWMQEFKLDRTRKNDERRSGRPSDTTTLEMITKFYV